MIVRFGVAELTAAVRDLTGARLVGVARTVNIIEINLVRDGVAVRLHVQCAFRLLKGDRIMMGSADLRYPVQSDADRDGAFDEYATRFDRSAELATSLLGRRVCPVLTAELGPGGALTLQVSDGLRVEVLPDVAGPIECWRLFAEGADEHFVYRPGAERTNAGAD